MNPWIPIGWIVLSAIIGVPLVFLCIQARRYFEFWLRCYRWARCWQKTRLVPPAVGQTWKNIKGEHYNIMIVCKDFIRVESGQRGSTWSYSHTEKEWQERVDRSKLVLVYPIQ